MNWREVPCPKCNRRGLHYADHPHACGYKDYGVIACRFCHGRFDADKLETRIKSEEDA